MSQGVKQSLINYNGFRETICAKAGNESVERGTSDSMIHNSMLLISASNHAIYEFFLETYSIDMKVEINIYST